MTTREQNQVLESVILRTLSLMASSHAGSAEFHMQVGDRSKATADAVASLACTLAGMRWLGWCDREGNRYAHGDDRRGTGIQCTGSRVRVSGGAT